MPLYDFRCKKCGLQFEELCKSSKDIDIGCLCGSFDVERLMSGFAATFANPADNSKMHDSFSYRAGVNMEKAKDQRRHAQQHDHMGANPYKDADTRLDQ
jgi:putative FmdB family regulatory protein